MSVFNYQSARSLERLTRRTSFGWLVPCMVLLCVIVWAAKQVSAAESTPPFYLIGANDQLQVTVWADPELSTTTTVRPDGRISVPLVEDLPAAGRTPAEVAREIQERLATYRKDPLVTVVVVSGLGDPSQQIKVVGEAVRPQTIPYRAGITLLDAVIAAGGLSREAGGNSSHVVRRENGTSVEIPARLSDLVHEGDPTANMALQPGDVVVIPEGFFDGEWHVTHRASASETFSDNIDQDPDGERESAFITRAGPGISITGSSVRIVGALDGDIFGVYQTGGEDEGFSLDPEINGTSTTELLSDHLFLDLGASVSRQLLDPRDATSGSDASTTNRDLIATLTASPYLIHQLGDFADVEWRYRVTPVLVDSSSESDGLNQEASVVLGSGEEFSRFSWTLSNIARLEERSSEGDIKTANTDLELQYLLWDGFSLIGATGYEYRSGDEDESNNFEGVTWRGGFNYQPHPDLNLQATYGRRDDDDSLNASLNYQVGSWTTLTASYSEALETSQSREESNLRRFEIDPDTGELIVTDDDPFTFEDETTRTKTLRVGAQYARDGDRFALSGLKGSSTGGSEGDEDFYEARITWSHAFDEEFNLNTSASYEHSNFDEENRTDDTYRVNLSLGYQLSPNAQTFLGYSFQTRDSSEDDESFTENTVTIGISASY